MDDYELVVLILAGGMAFGIVVARWLPGAGRFEQEAGDRGAAPATTASAGRRSDAAEALQRRAAAREAARRAQDRDREGRPTVAEPLRRPPEDRKPTEGRGSAEERGFSNMEQQSPLKLLGYAVGASSSLLPRERREILRQACDDHLPNAYQQDYAEAWGAPGTKKRFRRVRDHIACMCELHERRRNMRQAVRDWKTDLVWLAQTYPERS